MIPESQFRVEFDPRVKKQLEEAKQKYQSAKLQGRTVFSTTGNEINSWQVVRDGFVVAPKALSDNQFALRILDETGDRRIVWDLLSPKETNEAKKKFDEYQLKGWRAYAIAKDGTRSHRIASFDETLQEVIFADSDVKQKLSAFVKNVSEVRMVPKTYPG